MKFNPVTEYSIPTEELHPLQAYDRGFLHGEEFATFQESERIIDLVDKWGPTIIQGPCLDKSHLIALIRGEK